MLTRQALIFCKVEKAIKEMRNKKATRNDVHGDILKLLEENGFKLIRQLSTTYMNLHNYATISVKLQSLPYRGSKKLKKSSDNRTISHIAHTANVVARILRRSTEKKTKEYIQDQSRFRREEWTTDTTGTLRTISKELWTPKRNCVLASQTGGTLIRKFHTDRKVKIPLDHGETKSAEIRTGVRQEWCLAPILLDMQSEFVTNEVLEVFVHFKIRGQVIHTIKYRNLICCSRKKRRYTTCKIAVFKKKKVLFTSILGLNLRKKLITATFGT